MLLYIMSGQPNKNPTDPAKFRQQYMANLALEANVNDKNLQANKIYQKSGQVPSQMTDTRTTAEKLADVERLKIDVRSELSEIADGMEANAIVQALPAFELQFLAQHIKEIVADIKPKYKYGITADIFIPYLVSYITKAVQTNEVNYGLQQATGNHILLGIQQILGNMVNQQQLGLLYQQLVAAHQHGFINTALLIALQNEARNLANIIPDRNFMGGLAQMQDANLKAMVQQELNDALQNMPTQQQLTGLQQQLDQAIQNGDRQRADQIAHALRDILALNPATVEQMQRLQAEVMGEFGKLRNDVLGLTNSLRDDIQIELQLAGVSNQTLIRKVIGDLEISLKRNTSDEIGQVAEDLIKKLNETRHKGETLTSVVVKRCVKDAIAETLGEQAMLSPFQPSPNPFRMLSPNISPTEIQKAYEQDVKFSRPRPRRPQRIISPYSDILGEVGLPPSAVLSYGGESPSAAPKPNLNRSRSSRIPTRTSNEGGGGGGKSGKGFRMSGRGVSKKPNVILQTDFSQGIMPTQKYVPFGRYYIDHHRLNDDVISLRRGNGVNIVGLPVRRVSKDLGEVVRTVLKHGHPSYNQIDKLNKEEKDYLHKLAKSSNLLDRLHIPSPTKEEDDQDVNQFEILKGELLCGNDGSETVKKFKVLVMRMMNKGLLPKGQAKDILIELATLGY